MIQNLNFTTKLGTFMATRSPFGRVKRQSATTPPYDSNYDKANRRASRQAAALLAQKTNMETSIKSKNNAELSVPKWVQQALSEGAIPSRGVELVRGDGVDHINIGGRTELGLMLSHFAHTPFIHSYFGPFNCMEGFWQYIKSEKRDDSLRALIGFKAKARGKEISGNEPHNRKFEKFTELIFDANYQRIKQNPRLRELLTASDLPFDHYYLFGSGNVVIHPLGHEWFVAQFEQLRKMFKEGREPAAIDYSAFA